MYVCPCIIYEIDERYPLDAAIHLQTLTPMQRLTHTPPPLIPAIYTYNTLWQPTNAQFSFIVLDTVWSSIIRIQPNTPEDGHVELFIILNKLLHQVGISRLLLININVIKFTFFFLF